MLKKLNEAFIRVAQNERFAGFDWSKIDDRLTDEFVRLTSNFLCSAAVAHPLVKEKRQRRKGKNHTERDKQFARRSLREAVRKGTIIKPMSCERCGCHVSSHLIHGHHSDYSKPYQVEWLCSDCHSDEHASKGVNVKTEVFIRTNA